jgi:uncharacterized protein with PCYCGC motif
MKKKALALIVVAVAVLVGAMVLRQPRSTNNAPVARPTAPSQPSARRQPSQPTAHVPAHYETAPVTSSLGATLAPAKFFGKTKQAYEVARKIPVTLAQLPCYCHCDQSVGHKSLHSCFEDEHAASCAVCVDEALLAYQLEKRGKPATQIREQIIAQYSMTTHDPRK